MSPISNIAKTPNQVNFQSQKKIFNKERILNKINITVTKAEEVLLKLVEAGGTKTVDMLKEQVQSKADKRKAQIDEKHQSIKTSIITAIHEIAKAIQNIINDFKK